VLIRKKIRNARNMALFTAVLDTWDHSVTFEFQTVKGKATIRLSEVLHQIADARGRIEYKP
jgi:hypothetical protein